MFSTEPVPVSILPGRIRWSVPDIRNAPAVAAQLTHELRAAEVIYEADASAVTARLLVQFPPETPFETIRGIVTAAVARVMSRSLPRGIRPAADDDESADAHDELKIPARNVFLAGSALAAGMLLSNAAVSTVILSAGAAVAIGAGLLLGVRYAARRVLAEDLAALREGRTGPVLALMRRYGSALVLPSATSFFVRVFDLLPPFLVGLAVNILVSGASPLLAAIGISTVTGQFVFLAVAGAALSGIGSVLEYRQSRMWSALAQQVRLELRLEVYRHVQTLDLAVIERRSSGEMLNLLLDDVDRVVAFIEVGANDIMQAATSILYPLAILVVLPPWLALLALLPIPLTIAASLWFQERTGRRYDDVRAGADQLALQLATNLSGIATIKSFTAEERAAREIEEIGEEYRLRSDRTNQLVAAFNPAMRTIVVLGFDLVLLSTGLIAAGSAVSIGLFSAMVYLSLRMWYPLTRLGPTFELFEHGSAALRRIYALLDMRPRIEGGPRLFDASAMGGAVAFDRVHFAYDEQHPILADISLSVPPGATLGIVGPSGSGKSTLVKLLLRFYDVAAGRVSIGGRDVRELSLAALRRAVSLVSQDAYLFHGTIRENIALGKEGASFEQIVEAARIAQAHAFIILLPHGYDTAVGERGVRLSGGERQRIAVARALLKDAPILVLDEATSAIDSRTEAALVDALSKSFPDRIKIVIAHRLSTVRNAGEIVVLQDGRIRERGDHESLLARQGLYAALWQLQSGEWPYEAAIDR